MSRAESLIQFYQAGFKICLGLSVFFLILTVFLFFRLGIRNIVEDRLGRSQKRSIEQMREANQKTGRLGHAQKVAQGEYTPISLNDSKTQETPTAQQTRQDTRHRAAFGDFTVTKEVMIIHSEEWI